MLSVWPSAWARSAYNSRNPLDGKRSRSIGPREVTMRAQDSWYIAILRYSALCVALVSLIPTVAWGAPSGKQLLDALRDGDEALIKRLVQDGAPVNASDEFGSSSLMYASLYSDAAVVRLLLDRGADPNHADNSGATALVWAIPDGTKVRL